MVVFGHIFAFCDIISRIFPTNSVFSWVVLPEGSINFSLKLFGI